MNNSNLLNLLNSSTLLKHTNINLLKQSHNNLLKHSNNLSTHTNSCWLSWLDICAGVGIFENKLILEMQWR